MKSVFVTGCVCSSCVGDYNKLYWPLPWLQCGSWCCLLGNFVQFLSRLWFGSFDIFSGMIAFYLLRMCRRLFNQTGPSNVAPSSHKKFPPYIFWLPALCDMLGTSTMYLGLTLTYASSFQMLRGQFRDVYLNRNMHSTFFNNLFIYVHISIIIETF